MKKNSVQIIIVILLLIGKTSFAQWSNVNPNGAFPIKRQATFVIRDTAYIANGDPSNSSYTNNVHGFTQNSNTWVQLRTCKSPGGDQGFSFVLGDTAYIGDGANPGWHNDFFYYTPTSGWSNNLGAPPGGSRIFSAGFSIGNRGYFGTGISSGNQPLKDFYEYNPSSGWTTKASLPVARGGGVAFALNGKGYMGLGYRDNSSPVVLKDMYRYDPVTDKWDTMAPIPTSFGEAEPAWFVLCGKLIIVSGQTSHAIDSATSQTWMFDPADGTKGTWMRLPDFAGTPVYSPQGFAMGDTGFVYGGYDPISNKTLSQMWRYIPLLLTVTPDVSICSGASTVLKANGSSAYKWLPSLGLSDSVTYSSSIPGAVTQTTASPSVSTTYTVTEAVCGTQATVKVTVVNTSSKPDIGSDTSFCNNFNLTLDAGSTGLNYEWSTGETTSAINVSSLGTYSLTVTAGCSTGSDTINITGGTAQAGTITALRDTICEGTPGSLKVKGNSGSVQWQSSFAQVKFANISLATDTSLVTIPIQTSYYRVYTVNGNCSDTSSAYKLIVAPSPVAKYNYTTSGSGGMIVSFNSDSSEGETIYNWDFGDGSPLSSDANPSHTYIHSDTFHVCLTVYNGSNCSFTLCRDIKVGTDRVSNLSAKNSFSIYPDPFTDNIFVSTSGNGNIESISIYDMLGRLMLNKEMILTSKTPLQLDVSGFTRGIYFMKIKTREIDFVQKIIKE